MSDSTVTTVWKSAFSYDNVDRSYHDLFPFDNNLVFRSDGQFYSISSYRAFDFSGSDFLPSYDASSMVYNVESGFWESFALSRPSHFDHVEVIAQDMDSSLDTFYSTSDLRSGSFPAPSGTYFDGIYVDSVLSEIVGLLSVVLPIMIIYASVRKGMSFLLSLMRGG